MLASTLFLGSLSFLAGYVALQYLLSFSDKHVRRHYPAKPGRDLP
jgi:hypothetical protein